MKDFNLVEAKAGKPVCTRGGKPARIVCWDMKGKYCIGALVTDTIGEEQFIRYDKDGFSKCSHWNSLDLQMVTAPSKPRHHAGWVTLLYDKEYRRVVNSPITTTEDAAKNVKYSKDAYIYLKTVNIEWEE